MYGELIPMGGGDVIPLLKTELLVGRRESCDIVLRFANVSAHHCDLLVESGYWYAVDRNSRNGTKVNGQRVQRKRLDPGCELSIAKHVFTVNYNPADLGATGRPPADDDEWGDIMNRSLLERSGLDRRGDKPRKKISDGKEAEEVVGPESVRDLDDLA